MKHTRSILTVILGITFLTSASLLQAADQPEIELSEKVRLRHEATGVLSGAVIGGLVGGPVGAVVTAAFGSWVSDKTLAKKQNTLLTAALTERQQELLALQAEYRALQARYRVAANDSRTAQLRNTSLAAESISPSSVTDAIACCNDSELSLHFKTGSARVETLYDDKLREFASFVNGLPDAVIEITGHADRRGESAANLALSQQRIQAVETKLRTLGVRNKAVQTSAFGDSRPLSQADSLENNFYDRRVVVKIISTGNGFLTRAND